MEKPKVELKNVKTFEGHEGIGFNVDVYINGVKCIHARDDAYGGCLDIDVLGDRNTNERLLINTNVQLVEDYLKSLPVEPFILNGEQLKNIDGKLCFLNNDMESLINQLFEEYLKNKEDKKFEKKCEKAICFGVPNGYSYQCIKYKEPLVKYGKDILQILVKQIKVKYCTNGVVILNKNLEALGVIV